MNKKDMATLQFKGYEIEKMVIERLNEFTEEKSFSIMYKIVPSNETFDKVNILQGILIEGNKEFPYVLEVKLRGNFLFEESLEIDKKKKMLRENCAAILYPYVRSLVSLLSSQTEFEKIILPTMNFSSFTEKLKDEDLILGSNTFIDFK